jgi:hypothetical protein
MELMNNYLCVPDIRAVPQARLSVHLGFRNFFLFQ